MNSKVNFILAAIIAALLIYQGIFYRWIGYESKPLVMLDEYSYVWQGLSTRISGLPFAWTTYPDNYEKGENKFNKGTVDGLLVKLEDQQINAHKFKQNPQPILTVEKLDFGEGEKYLSFVAPFFDRPPLGGLILSLGIDSSVQTHADVKSADFRRVNLALGIIISALIFIFTLLITNSPWAGVFSVGIYNTVPTFIFGSRLSLGENIGVPFVLMHLILLVLSKKLLGKKVTLPLIFLSGLMAGVAFLAKESLLGFAAGSTLLMFIWKVPRKIIGIFIIGILIPIISYISWGLWLQGELFLNIFLSNIGRPFFGSLKFLMVLQGLRFQDFPIDGWWIWGFVSLFIICFSFGKNYLPLIIPVLFHLALVIFMGGANYPWYYLALVPFLAISSAIVILNCLRSPNISTLAAFFFIAVSSSFYWGYSVLHNLGDGIGYKLLFLVFFFFLFIRIYFAKYKLPNLLWYVFFVFLLYQVMKWNNYSILYFTQSWGNLPIPSLPKI